MVNCPFCSEEYIPGDRFCENCSEPLPVPEGAGPIVPVEMCSCGSKAWDEDGMCEVCGYPKLQTKSVSYIAAIGPGLVGATNIGLKHRRNEDAFAINGNSQGGPGSVIVVCDGVSSSQNPQLASAVAAKAACDLAFDKISSGELQEIMRQSIVSAHDAVCSVPFNRQDQLDPPSCTIVAAAIEAEENFTRKVTVAWLGDSRAYWLTPDGKGKQLTRDHSWVEEVVSSGAFTQEQAERDRRAHAITKYLGTSDFSAPTVCMEPSVEEFTLPAQGVLLLCSDGLWNYAPSISEILASAGESLWKENLSEACEKMICFANKQGGRDNTTVVLAKL